MRKKKALRTVFLILIICALIFIAYEVLCVRTITVTGCEARTEQEVISLSGLKTGVSVFGVDTEKIMESLKADPYIKPVSVTIIYPDRLSITIEERKEAAYIKKDAALLIIDDECWLLRIAAGESAPYTQVFGITLDEMNVGERLGAVDPFQLDVLSNVMKQAADSEALLSGIDVSYAADVVLASDGFKVEIGDDTRLKEKFSLMLSAAGELKGMGKTGGVIDVASAGNAYYREK